jgi:predicted Zn-dependent peptidase
VVLAWKVPPQTGHDRWVHEALTDILAGGDYSRMHTKLVKDAGAAVSVASFAGFPGSMDPCLLLLIVRPAKDVPLAECVRLAQAEVESIATGGVTESELAGVRRRAKMSLLESIETNSGLAGQLCSFEAEEGDWRRLFDSVDALSGVRSADLAEAAGRLTVMQRTTGYLMPPGMTVAGEVSE